MRAGCIAPTPPYTPDASQGAASWPRIVSLKPSHPTRRPNSGDFWAYLAKPQGSLEVVGWRWYSLSRCHDRGNLYRPGGPKRYRTRDGTRTRPSGIDGVGGNRNTWTAHVGRQSAGCLPTQANTRIRIWAVTASSGQKGCRYRDAVCLSVVLRCNIFDDIARGGRLDAIRDPISTLAAAFIPTTAIDDVPLKGGKAKDSRWTNREVIANQLLIGVYCPSKCGCRATVRDVAVKAWSGPAPTGGCGGRTRGLIRSARCSL